MFFLLWLGLSFANKEELSKPCTCFDKPRCWEVKKKKKSEKWLLNVPFPSIFQKVICHYRAPLRLQLRKKNDNFECGNSFNILKEKKSQKCNTIHRKLYCSMWKHRMASGIKEYKKSQTEGVKRSRGWQKWCAVRRKEKRIKGEK